MSRKSMLLVSYAHRISVLLSVVCIASVSHAEAVILHGDYATSPVNGHVYTVSAEPVNYSDALKLASILGGNLATIRTAEEYSWYRTEYPFNVPTPNHTWIGLYRDVDGWHWRSGEVSDYRDWGANEPSVGSIVIVSWNGSGWHTQENASWLRTALIEIIPCPTDLNDDGVTDTADLGLLIALFGKADPVLASADINADGTVDTADLGILIGAFGTSCP